jgi:hypothetical protein
VKEQSVFDESATAGAGTKRTDEVIQNKPWSTWIYKTVLRDEAKIRAVVQEPGLEVK